MRTSFLLAGLSLWMSGCAAEPDALRDPPRLVVTEPARALVRGSTGPITVAGRVERNAEGDRISQVLVNGVAAQLAADGSFTAQVQLVPGATLLHTVVRDAAGGEATDTRAVQAGALRGGGELIDHGLQVALSDDALDRLASAAGALMQSTDFAPLLAPRNPMVSEGADTGEDCLWGKVYVDDLNLGGARLALAPGQGTLTFEAELTNLDVRARARYAALCVDGATSVRMTASKLLVRGALRVAPRASGQGFAVSLAAPQVTVTGFGLAASGVPGDVLSLLRLDSAIGSIAGAAAEQIMEPLLNQALGSLAGPKQVTVAGKTVTFEVAADAVALDVTGARVGLDSRMILAGHDARYVATPDDPLVLAPASGFALAISDDAINQLLASVAASGMLELSMPAPGGTFETVKVQATLPPMISADGSGKLRLVAGDLRMTLLSREGVEVTHVALSLAADLAVAPAAAGVVLQVGKPEIHADVLDSTSGYADADKEQLIELVVTHQLKVLSLLLGYIPLPTLGGVTITEPRVSASAGYVRVTGGLR